MVSLFWRVGRKKSKTLIPLTETPNPKQTQNKQKYFKFINFLFRLITVFCTIFNVLAAIVFVYNVQMFCSYKNKNVFLFNKQNINYNGTPLPSNTCSGLLHLK